jgi:hypothetical protein
MGGVAKALAVKAPPMMKKIKAISIYNRAMSDTH